MKYKALILDLDGTTIPSRADGMPSEKVKAAIWDAQKYVKVAVATGRPLWLCDHILKGLRIDHPCIVDNGAQIINPKKGSILSQKPLSVDVQREVFAIARSFKYKLIDSTEKNNGITSARQITQQVGKLVILNISPEDTIKLIEELSSVAGILALPTTAFTKGLSDILITHETASKKHALEELVTMLNVTHEQIIGVGDNHNDFTLLKAVGLKVAMGNAPKELKEIADYIAPTVDNDGVADVINKYIIGNA